MRVKSASRFRSRTALIEHLDVIYKTDGIIGIEMDQRILGYDDNITYKNAYDFIVRNYNK